MVWQLRILNCVKYSCHHELDNARTKPRNLLKKYLVVKIIEHFIHFTFNKICLESKQLMQLFIVLYSVFFLHSRQSTGQRNAHIEDNIVTVKQNLLQEILILCLFPFLGFVLKLVHHITHEVCVCVLILSVSIKSLKSSSKYRILRNYSWQI